MTAPRRDLDALLRSPVEPLPPPPGTWPEIRRRAARMRTARRATTVAAAVAAVATIAVPVILVLHGVAPASRSGAAGRAGHARQASHPRPGWPTPATTTYSRWRPPAALSGLQPLSVSFAEQTTGYLLGRSGGQPRLARTTDSGSSWSSLPIPGGFRIGGSGPAPGVRFATTHIGFLYGSTLWSTANRGVTWKQLADPGRITDMEIAGGAKGRLWALAEQCPRHCDVERLYTARVADPRLRPVLDVTTLPDPAAQLSLTAQGDGVFVLANRAHGEPLRFWSTDGGRTWSGDTGPCVHHGTVAALIPSEAAVVCSAPGRQGDSAREYLILDHLDSARHHQLVDVAAPPVGTLAGLSANNAGAVVIADGFPSGVRTDAPFQVSTDAGHSWQPAGPHLPGGAGFVGFISPTRVVALSAPDGHAFLASDDGGLSWRVTSFGR